MKHKWYFRGWLKIVYRRTKIEDGFEKWSDWISVYGDSNPLIKESRSIHEGILGWLMKRFWWKRIAVLTPVGKPDDEFRLGFDTSTHICRLSPIVQKVSDGSFGVRVGAKDISFFIVSKNGARLSQTVSQFNIGSKVAQKYKDITIY